MKKIPGARERKTEQFQVLVNRHLHRRIRQVSVDSSCSMREVAEAAVRDFFGLPDDGSEDEEVLSLRRP